MSKLFLHIGLGKAASSKLQRDILPHIAKFLDFEYVGNENIPYSDYYISSGI